MGIECTQTAVKTLLNEAESAKRFLNPASALKKFSGSTKALKELPKDVYVSHKYIKQDSVPPLLKNLLKKFLEDVNVPPNNIKQVFSDPILLEKFLKDVFIPYHIRKHVPASPLREKFLKDVFVSGKSSKIKVNDVLPKKDMYIHIKK